MMGHVITLNIGKTMLPDGVHGDATGRGGGHYLGMIVVCVGIYGGMASCYGRYYREYWHVRRLCACNESVYVCVHLIVFEV